MSRPPGPPEDARTRVDASRVRRRAALGRLVLGATGIVPSLPLTHLSPRPEPGRLASSSRRPSRSCSTLVPPGPSGGRFRNRCLCAPTASSSEGRRAFFRPASAAPDPASVTAHVVNVLMGGLFHAAILFLVAAGLQVVFGVQRIFNLACGSFYALGAYVGVAAVQAFIRSGGPPQLFILPLVAAGLLAGLVGILVERGLLRFIYDRDETLQLLLTFAVVLMLEDLIQMVWGAAPASTSGLYLVYGQVRLLGATIPTYNLIVIGSSLVIAAGIGWLLARTVFGRIVRAAAENREMAEALGIDMRQVYVRVFTLGSMLGTLGGALVIPSTAAMSEMGVELIVEAFAVVVIGGLGSMRGALAGALAVGVLRAIAIAVYPALEMLLIYVIVIAVLVLRPRGLFGKVATA